VSSINKDGQQGAGAVASHPLQHCHTVSAASLATFLRCIEKQEQGEKERMKGGQCACSNLSC